MKFKFTIFFLCCSLLQAAAQDAEDAKLMYFPQAGVLKRIIRQVITVPHFTQEEIAVPRFIKVTRLHKKLARKNITVKEIKAEISLAITYYFDYLRAIDLPEKTINNFENIAFKNEELLISKICKTGLVVKGKSPEKKAQLKAKL